MNARTFACVMTTPLGVPVEPDVNRMCAGSCGPFALGGGVVGCDAASSSVNSAWTPAGGSSVPTQPTACVAPNPGRANNASTVGPTAPLARIQRLSHEAIIFSSRGTGLPGSSGTYTASALSTPRIAMIAAGDLGVSRQTRSPRAQPAALRRCANRLLARSSSPYVRRSRLNTSAPASGRRSACALTSCCNRRLTGSRARPRAHTRRRCAPALPGSPVRPG